MKRVTGIGGIFFKAKDAPALRAWYKQHLGIDVQGWGGTAFTWTDGEGNLVAGTTAWSIGTEQSDQFAPSTATFMVNTAWRISTHWSKLCAKKAAMYSRRWTSPSTESLVGSSIRRETRWNYGNHLPANDDGCGATSVSTYRRLFVSDGFKRMTSQGRSCEARIHRLLAGWRQPDPSGEIVLSTHCCRSRTAAIG